MGGVEVKAENNVSRLKALFDDRLLGLLGIMAGIAVLWLMPWAVRASTFLLPGTDILFIRGDFFPRVVGWGFVIIGGWLALAEHFRRLRGLAHEPWPAAVTSRRELVAALMFVAGVAFYVLGVTSVGFLPATAVMFLVLSRWLGAPWRAAVATAIIGSLTMELIFGGLLGIPLPGRIIRF